MSFTSCDTRYKMNLPPKVKQAIFASASLLNLMNMGKSLAHASLIIPALLEEKGDGIKANHNSASWLASIPGISSAIAVITVGPLMHYYGRRTVQLITSSIILLGWILIGLSNSMIILLIGRALQGISNGLAYFNSICIGELSCPSIRGVLLNFKIFNVSIGIIMIHGLGYFLDWRTLSWVGTISEAFALMIAFFWPETPDWLVSQGKYEEAEKVFISLRGRSIGSEKEIRKVIEAAKRRKEDRLGQEGFKVNLKKMRSCVLWRPVIVLFCAMIIPEAGGRRFFPSYSLQLAGQISGDKSKGFMYTMIVDIIGLIATGLSGILVGKFARRSLVLNCGFAANIFLLLSCLLIFIKKNYFESDILKWIYISSFGIYFALVDGATFGVCYVLMGELFPIEYRSTGMMICGVFSCICLTIFMKLTYVLNELIDIEGMFFVYSILMILSIAYMHYELPETKNRTLHDIGNYFRGLSPKIRPDNEKLGDDEERVSLNKDKD